VNKGENGDIDRELPSKLGITSCEMLSADGTTLVVRDYGVQQGRVSSK
jgi:hypothetical protein